LLPLLLLQAAAASDDPALAARFDACIDKAVEDPPAGVAEANAWLVEGGGYLARHCLGFAYAGDQLWQASATAFAQAAREAELAHDARAANLWSQAGNAALAGGDTALALGYFDAALVQQDMDPFRRGELQLDRARTLVLLDRPDEAQAAFDAAHRLIPEDPLGWLLSATLARRQNRLDRAQADIDVAARLAPRDPSIGLEAGNIAAAAGNYDVARRNWQQAIDIEPDGPIAKIARQRIATLDAEPG